MTMKLDKAVFPVAGMGTRFLPATKANPKEMLPVVDKPLIQYAAEEAIAAGITELIFVTSSSKRAIEDHFDKNYELEDKLERRGKQELLSIVRDVVPEGVSCVYIRQPEALGLGHAVLCAKPAVGNDPFAVILADDLIYDEGAYCLSQMMDVFTAHQCSVLGTEEVDHSETDKYGICQMTAVSEREGTLEAIVEKPKPDKAPSNLAVVGRYILTPRIFAMLEETPHGAGGEIQLTDAIAALMAEERVMTYQFTGKRYDCGDKLGYLQATVEYALRHPTLKDSFGSYMQDLLATRFTR
ncbi:MAG: UTP--glucose-1-phosphate uridylyltransferase GalU [Gammaproteobacteria bacterium]|jgi:UTP--glucose-1-phosphate uridylyltransferase